MSKKTGRLTAILLGLALGLILVSQGWAFCVQNETQTPLFARSLDSVKFQANIPPGDNQCCEGCINRKRGKTTLLIVSGYEPISKNSHPGWQGECRIHAVESSNITVTGSLTKLICQ
jgi:hypothetical protein